MPVLYIRTELEAKVVTDTAKIQPFVADKVSTWWMNIIIVI